jgi:hypothetical protein
MSIMAMKRFVEKHGTKVIAVLAVPLLIGVVYSGLGANIGGGAAKRAADDEKAVAQIGGTKITKSMLDRQLEQQMRGMAGSPTPEIQDMYRLMLVEQFKGREAIVQAAKKAGVEVTDAQIEEMRDKKWNESVRSAIASQLGIDPKSDDRTVEEALQKMNPDPPLPCRHPRRPPSRRPTLLLPLSLPPQLRRSPLQCLLPHHRPTGRV